MGCFDSTCAITRTSIHYGDEVLIVEIQEGWGIKGIYELEQRLDSYLEYRETQPRRPSPLRFVQVGKYNDYGSIEELESNEEGLTNKSDWQEHQFLCHKCAVDQLLDKPFEEYEDPLEALRKLLDVCFRARIQVFGHNLIGCQHYDKEELELQRKVLQITDQLITKKEDSLTEEDYYEDYWEREEEEEDS